MAPPPSKGSGGSTRTYEIQRYSGGRWMLDSVADDKEMAVAVAKSLTSGSRAASSVRVMAVQQFDDGQFSEVTVYRSTPIDDHNAEAVVRKLKVEDEVKAFREQRDFERKHKDDPPPAPKPRKKGRFADFILALQLAFGIGLTITAIQMLRIVMH
ncbi:MAG TPA: hypothetical protein VMU85_15180 [Stellaceae bacterium]|nr:hypothetical protein [Stellaceae bacterium]